MTEITIVELPFESAQELAQKMGAAVPKGTPPSLLHMQQSYFFNVSWSIATQTR